MSQADVEAVRRFKYSINSRDAALWGELVAPDFEFRSVFVGVEGRIYRGPEGGKTYLDDLADAMEYVQIEIREQRDLGDGRVLTVMVVHTRGRESGAETATPLASIARVEDGRLVAYQSFRDVAEALAAADEG